MGTSIELGWGGKKKSYSRVFKNAATACTYVAEKGSIATFHRRGLSCVSNAAIDPLSSHVITTYSRVFENAAIASSINVAETGVYNRVF